MPAEPIIDLGVQWTAGEIQSIVMRLMDHEETEATPPTQVKVPPLGVPTPHSINGGADPGAYEVQTLGDALPESSGGRELFQDRETQHVREGSPHCGRPHDRNPNPNPNPMIIPLSYAVCARRRMSCIASLTQPWANPTSKAPHGRSCQPHPRGPRLPSRASQLGGTCFKFRRPRLQRGRRWNRSSERGGDDR